MNPEDLGVPRQASSPAPTFAININGTKITKSSHARSSRPNIVKRSLSC